MKKQTNLFMMLLLSASLFAQVKPDKTFDFDKFGKKVYGNFSAGMDQSIFLPDDKALEFISSKTGRTMDDLKAERELNKQYLSEDKMALQKENAGGLMVLKVELVKVDNPKLTMGNIIITAQNKIIELRNCIQTDRTWVLGDYMGIQGQQPDRGKAVAIEDNSNNVIIENVLTGNIILSNANVPFHGKLNFNKDLIGQVLQGCYVTTDGSIINAAILYDVPGNLQNNSVELSIYKKAVGEQGFTKENSNFDKKLSKNDLRAFYVDYHLYIKAGDSWYMLIEEAPISRLTQIASTSLSNIPANVEKADLVGKPVRGYYIDNSGNKIDAVIKYQNVAQLQDMNSTFLLYNIAYNESGYTEDETNNFKTFLAKSQVKEINLAGNTYFKVAAAPGKTGFEWRVKVDEVSYSTLKYIYKTGEAPLEESSLTLGFKNKVSKLTADNAVLSTKIANKEKGYNFLNLEKIITEYNTWYEKQYPGKFKYVLADTKNVTVESKTKKPDASTELETFGRTLLDALKSDTPDKLYALSWANQELINSIKVTTPSDEEMQNILINRFQRKDPNNLGMQKAVEEQFKKIKAAKLTWKAVQFVEFAFMKEDKLPRLNFDWGIAYLQFEVDERQYTLKIEGFMHLLTGWKGGTYMLQE